MHDKCTVLNICRNCVFFTLTHSGTVWEKHVTHYTTYTIECDMKADGKRGESYFRKYKNFTAEPTAISQKYHFQEIHF